MIDNALRASDADDAVHVFATLDSGVLRFEVVDSGSGMSAEVAERAFDLFFTTRASQGGSGIGLAVARELVEGLGGQIELNSRQGHGTRATIQFRMEDL